MRHRLLIFFAAAITIVPLLVTLTGTGSDGDQREQRRLAGWPDLQLSIAGLKKMPQQLEAWFNDHFGLRSRFVRFHDVLEYRLLGSSRRVLVGEQGWLFLERGIRTDVEMTPIVRDLCGEVPFSDQQLEHWAEALDRNRRELKKHNIEYVFMIVPNKHSLYHRFLPRARHCDSTETRFNQLSDRLKKNNAFNLIDLKTPLLEAAHGEEFVYHKTDTHWNGPGIRLAYAELGNYLNAHQIEWNNLESLGRIKSNRVHRKAGDLSRMAGLETTVTETMYGYTIHQPVAVELNNPWPNLSKDPYRQPEQWMLPESTSTTDVVIFHDSFVGRSVKTLFAESFAHSRFVWQGAPTLNLEILKSQPPTLVIHEMVERNLLQPW